MEPEVTIHTQPGTTGAIRLLSDTLMHEAQRIVSVFPAVCIGPASRVDNFIVGLYLKL